MGARSAMVSGSAGTPLSGPVGTFPVGRVRLTSRRTADAISNVTRGAGGDDIARHLSLDTTGTVFQVPWTRIDPWPDGIATLRAAGFVTASLALSDDAVSLADLVAEPRRSGSCSCLAPRGTGSSRRRSPRET